ncbi:MAG: hypothetical protein QGF31_02295, partial [Nitrospinota bacterium]|nr:hypothetical protein [Nitrospinota bacterium]
MEKDGIAHVVVGLPLKTVFSYKIPERLVPFIQKGMRVLVPFGPRRITGYVVETTNEIDSEYENKLKEIINVLDKAPVISLRLMDLTRWIADYYLAPWGEVIKTALPKSMERLKPKYEKHLSLIKNFTENDIKKKFSRSQKQQQVIRILLTGETSYKELGREIKSLSSVVNTLHKSGIIRIIRKEVGRNPLSNVEEEKSQKIPKTLNTEQFKTFKKISIGINEQKHKVYLLHGITGSGKTE